MSHNDAWDERADADPFLMLRGLIRDWWASQQVGNWIAALFLGSVISAVAVLLFAAHRHQAQLQGDYLTAGHQALADQDFSLARFHYTKCIQTGDDSPQVQFGLGLSLEGLEEYERAWQLMSAIAPETEPGYGPAHWWLAQRLVNQLNSSDQSALPSALHHVTSYLATSDEVDSNAKRLLSRLRLAEGATEQAIAALRESTREFPEDGVLLARALLARNRAEEAVTVAQTTIAKLQQQMAESDSSWEVRLACFNAQLLLGQYPAAEATLLGAPEADSSPQIAAALGQLYTTAAADTRSFDPTRRVQFLERALLKTPQNRELLNAFISMLARSRIQLSDRTLTRLQEYIGTLPADESQRDTDLRRLVLSRIAVQLKQFDSAVTQLRATEGRLPAAWLDLAYAHQAAGDPDAARQAAREATTANQRLLDKNSTDEIRLELLNAFVFLGEWERALSVLEVEPRSALLAYTRSHVLVLKSQAILPGNSEQEVAQRIQLLRLAMAQAPAHPSAFQTLAQFVDGPEPKRSLAREALEQAVADGTAPELAHFVLGTAAIEDQRFETALVHLERANQLVPKHPAVLNNLAWVLIRVQTADPERAFELIERAIAIEPRNAEMYETRGEIQVQRQRWLRAVEDLERVLQVYPDRKRTHELLAQAYGKLGMKSLAQKHAAHKKATLEADSSSD